jgi:hypothetical protein
MRSSRVKNSRISTVFPEDSTAHQICDCFTMLTEGELMLNCKCLTFWTPFKKVGHIKGSSQTVFKLFLDDKTMERDDEERTCPW